jgi:hypothetical protein
VQYILSSLFASILFSYYLTCFFLIFLLCCCLVLYVCFLFCLFCFCIVLCTVPPFVYRSLFPIFVQVYRPLPSGANSVTVNKYLIISYHIK